MTVLDSNKRLRREIYKAHGAWLAAGKTGDGQLSLADEPMIRLAAGAQHLQFSEFRRCVLALADLSFAILDSALFEDCKFTGASLSQGSALHTQFIRCEMSDVDLRLLDLSASVLKHCVLDGSVAERTLWKNAKLEHCHFVGVDLSDSVLDGAGFHDCNFRDSRLARIDSSGVLGGAEGTVFERCDFRGADFSGRRLINTTFVECRFHGITGVPTIDGPYTVLSPDLSPSGDGSEVVTEAVFKSRWA